MTHWATKYIGLPWTPEKNCWWLVRQLFQERFGLAMPDIGVGDLAMADQVGPIKTAAAESGFRPTKGKPKEDDILLCRDVIGKRHVGWIVEAQGKAWLLHNDGHLTERGPVGSVVAQTLNDAKAGGLSEIELWRRG